MKRHDVLVPVLATGVLLSGCSIEGTASAPSADTQLLNAYSNCKLVSASAENAPAKREGYPRADVEVVATKNAYADTKQIKYGKLIGYLLREGMTKPMSELPFGWQRNPDGSESQTKASEIPNLELFNETFNGRKLFDHEVIAVYATAQNNSVDEPKNSQRYCGEIVVGLLTSGELYANMVQPLAPPEATKLESGWGIGDEHCKPYC